MDHSPVNLADFVLQEVHKQTSEDALRKIVETKIGDTVKSAVDSAFRSYGNIGQQIEKAVANALSIGDRVDVPAYGNMVMALLRSKMDETLSELIKGKLDEEMTSILSIAPKEVTFSSVVKTMMDGIEVSERYGSRATCIIEESEYSAGSYFVGLDPQDHQKRYQCETSLYVTAEGKIASLTVDRKDVAKTISMGPYYGYQKMLFAAYACGSKLIMDDLDPPTNIGDY